MKARSTERKTQTKTPQKVKNTKNSGTLTSKTSIFESIFKWFRPETPRALEFKLLDYFLLLVTAILSLYTHLKDLGSPNSVVFDEVYFGNFTNYYVTSQYYFDIHPPLGKQITYFGAKLLGYDASLQFVRIGHEFENDQIWKLRLWPSLFGGLRAPVIFLAVRFLGASSMWSFLAGFLLAVDNGLICESRFVLIDAYLTYFACQTILFAAILSRKPKRLILFTILAGISVGCTVSVKFTGGGIALALVASFFINYTLKEAVALSCVAAFHALVVFYLSFIVHFMSLTKPGPGCPFHPPEFCEVLESGKINNPFIATVQLIEIMLRANLAIQDSHSYSSKWYQWPLMLGKGTYLWVKDNQQIWCVGNPVVWYFGIIGLVLWIITVVFKPGLRCTTWLVFGYLVSYLPFAHIKRVMWNYHYFIPLILSICSGVLALSAILPHSYVVPLILIAASIVAYIVYSPITYGTEISYAHFREIMFKRWIYA